MSRKKTPTEKAEEIIQNSEMDLEGANHHSMTNLPCRLFDELRTLVPVEDLPKLAKGIREAIESVI